MAGSLHDIQALRGVPADWPPMRRVEEGWERLDTDGRARVTQRLGPTLERFDPPEEVNEAALRRFFSYLGQMEVIAIDVPLDALAHADPETRPLLERQLADEVFHATLFGAIAARYGGPDDPVRQAERVLETIRAPEDLRVKHALLNLVAEEWFETLFEHAKTWGVADEIFQIALSDEERHVEEGHIHTEGLTPQAVEPAVRRFEEELFRLLQDPQVMLPTLSLAGEENFRRLSEAYLATHQEALDEIGLEPTQAFDEMVATLDDLREEDPRPDAIPNPKRIEPETQWRRTALHLWDAPRDPSMYGWFDIETDHIPTNKLTPLLVAAVGRVWNEYPRMNRYTLGGELYEPDTVNVGVRVALGDQGEALSTIVIPEAHKRSLHDIERILDTGVDEMNQLGQELETLSPDEDTEPLRDVLRDEELMGMVPPGTVAAPVTVSNVGSMGLSAGVGAMPGALGQSVELILGQVEQRPVWNGERYVPGDVATIGASADHRVIDGNHSAHAMDRLRDALSEDGVVEILNREDTLPADANLADIALADMGISPQRAEVLMSCKMPFWLGWLCWIFKK